MKWINLCSPVNDYVGHWYWNSFGTLIKGVMDICISLQLNDYKIFVNVTMVPDENDKLLHICIMGCFALV